MSMSSANRVIMITAIAAFMILDSSQSLCDATVATLIFLYAMALVPVYSTESASVFAWSTIGELLWTLTIIPAVVMFVACVHVGGSAAEGRHTAFYVAVLPVLAHVTVWALRRLGLSNIARQRSSEHEHQKSLVCLRTLSQLENSVGTTQNYTATEIGDSSGGGLITQRTGPATDDRVIISKHEYEQTTRGPHLLMHTHMCAKLEEMHIEKNGMLKAHRFQVGVLKTRILKMRALSDADDNISGKHEEEAKSEKTEAEDRIAFLEGQLATASAARETTTFARRESNEMCLKLQNKIDELTQFMGEMSSQYMSLIVQQEAPKCAADETHDCAPPLIVETNRRVASIVAEVADGLDGNDDTGGVQDKTQQSPSPGFSFQRTRRDMASVMDGENVCPAVGQAHITANNASASTIVLTVSPCGSTNSMGTTDSSGPNPPFTATTSSPASLSIVTSRPRASEKTLKRKVKRRRKKAKGLHRGRDADRMPDGYHDVRCSPQLDPKTSSA